MFCYPTADNCVCVVIDIQAKLLPAMNDPATVLNRAQMLVKGMNELNVPVVVTEQYPQGLGNTVPELAELFTENTPVIAKTSFSCFGEAAFAETMDVEKRPVMVIAGIESHVCVAQTALDALNAGFKVFIAADAVNSRKASDLDIALSQLRSAGCTVASAEAILFMLLKSAKHPSFKAISKLVR